MSNYPTFAELWQLSNKVGPKEKYAKHWQVLSMIKRIEIFNNVNLEDKPDLKDYLELTLKQQLLENKAISVPVIVSDPGDEQPGHHLWE